MTATEYLEELQERIRRAPADLIAARIRRARREANVDGQTLKLSHDELKDRMGSSSRQHLIKLEKGQHRPGAETLVKIAEATGRSVEWFIDPDLDPSPFPEEVAA